MAESKLTDRERNTLQYNNVDIIVEADIESVSGISFLIKDNTLPGNAFSSFAYLDDAKRFIDLGLDWDKMLKG